MGLKNMRFDREKRIIENVNLRRSTEYFGLKGGIMSGIWKNS